LQLFAWLTEDDASHGDVEVEDKCILRILGVGRIREGVRADLLQTFWYLDAAKPGVIYSYQHGSLCGGENNGEIAGADTANDVVGYKRGAGTEIEGHVAETYVSGCVPRS